MNLQGVQLWQELESGLSNKLDRIAIKMSAKKTNSQLRLSCADWRKCYY